MNNGNSGRKKKAPPTDTQGLPVVNQNYMQQQQPPQQNMYQQQPIPQYQQQMPLQQPQLNQQQSMQDLKPPSPTSYVSNSNNSISTAQTAKNVVKPKAFNSNIGNKARPTDTHSLPFPSGYYQMDFAVEHPSAYPNLLQNTGIPNKLTYTAANCGFEEFSQKNPLGRKPYQLKTKAKYMFVLTMYNEDVDLFSLTLEAVYKNIEYMLDKYQAEAEKKPEDEKLLEGGGKPGLTWSDIVVCIVADGRQKCPQNVKVAMELLGCYKSDEGVMTDLADSPVQAHIFEYTSSVHLVAERKKKSCHVAPSKYPVQYLVCMKEFNKKKIDSHGWAINGFCPLLEPEVVVLLDMGTKPEKSSMYQFWKHFEGNERLGGVCGEIIVEVKGSWFLRRWINFWKDPLLAAQNFEYKMSNILDKSLQSLTGYITVLPGAFSAYRYKALLGKPLEEYFKAEKKEDEHVEEPRVTSIATLRLITKSNMYLAEDRILSFEIFNKAKSDWLLRYIKEAKATTDAPDNLGAFLNQRRRWLNGSLFAFLFGFFSMFQVFKTSHSFGRKMGFIALMFYLMVDTLFTLIGPMNFYAIYILSLLNISDALGINAAVVYALGFVYILLFVFGIVIFVGNNPRGSQFLYTFLSRVWGLMMILVVLALGYNSYLLFTSSPEPGKVVLFLLAILVTYGLYIGSSLLFWDGSHIVSSMIGYFWMVPTYVNMMLPFSLSNVHDISWGTRPAEPETARILKKNQMVNGVAEVSSDQAAGGIVVDVNDLQNKIKPPSDGKEKKVKPAQSTEDQNKNVRFILLFVFFFVNLLGSAAITYGASVFTTPADQVGQVQGGFNIFVVNYMIALFISIAFFAVVRFIGAIFFKSTTPVYK